MNAKGCSFEAFNQLMFLSSVKHIVYQQPRYGDTFDAIGSQI